MDNFIKKIRKSQLTVDKESKDKPFEENAKNEAFRKTSIDDNDSNFILTKENNNFSETIKASKVSKTNSSCNSNDSILEIRTSQSQEISGGNIFKYNYEHLETYCKKYEDIIKVSSIKNYEGYKINETICALVQSIYKFRDTYKLELIDETGVIIGHTDIDDINVGDLLILKECSLWKIDENQLNIVRENLHFIYK